MIKASLLERRLRITTGVILSVYITLHLSNHALGLVSLEAMEAMREPLVAIWRSWIGFALIYGSLLTHFGLALMSIYRRTTLSMPAWELLQLLLGLSIIPLLAGHIGGTMGSRVLMGAEINYESELSGLLTNDWFAFKRALLVVVAWAHAVVGLHFFLRLFGWYRRWPQVLYPIAILLPLLVFLSMARLNIEFDQAAQQAEPAAYQGGYGDSYGAAPTYGNATYGDAASESELAPNELLEVAILWGFYGALLLTLAARSLRNWRQRRRSDLALRHINGQLLQGNVGQSILEIIRSHAVPHASLCGGRGRCTTCRVRIDEGCEQLEPPSKLEAAALQKIGAAPNVRLACQTRPQIPIQITPLLPADVRVDSVWREGGVSGEERDVVALFVDLRGSSKISEDHLPYDVLFILNRFFLEMWAALKASHGHYAQFAGDGLMALYGLERGLEQGCREVIRGAVEMQTRIEKLNRTLAGELREPLRIGIGVHCGQAIVGTMGPPRSPNYSAIGDCINAAARLEGKTKDFECELVVSDDVLRNAGIDFGRFPSQQVSLRGKQQKVQVYIVKDTAAISIDEA